MQTRLIQIFVVVVLFLVPDQIIAQQFHTGPAPIGNPKVVSEKVIWENFDKKVCPSVIAAARLSDGSIRATCANREAFLVFSLPMSGSIHNLAMRCSAAKRLLGITAC